MNAPLRALTLWQPWASFMVALPDPPKTIETRPWSTNYRGRLAIHAAKSEPRDVRDWFSFGPERSLLMRCFADLARLDRFSPEPSVADVFAALPRGALLGTVDLFDVRRTPIVLGDGAEGDTERLLGDYSPGRFAWFTRKPSQLIEPIPWKGAQGLWTVPDGVLPVALGRAPTR